MTPNEPPDALANVRASILQGAVACEIESAQYDDPTEAQEWLSDAAALRRLAAACDEGAVDRLIVALDDIAREKDGYDYGLPIYDDEAMQKMRAAIHTFLATPEGV